MQSVVLYCSEMWNLTRAVLAQLEGIHVRAAYKMVRKYKPRKELFGKWKYPSTKDVLKECGLHSVEEYIQTRRAMIAMYVIDCPLSGMQGGGPSKRLNAAPVVVGAGVGLRQLSLLLDQHSWQAGDGCTWSQWNNWTKRTDGAKRSTEIPYSGVGRSGWWVAEQICGLVENL